MTKQFVIRAYTAENNSLRIISGYMDRDLLNGRKSALFFATLNTQGKLGIFDNGTAAYEFYNQLLPDNQNIEYDDLFATIFVSEFLAHVFNNIDFENLDKTDSFVIKFPYLITHRQVRNWLDKIDNTNYDLLACWLFNYDVHLEDNHLYRLDEYEVTELTELYEEWNPDTRPIALERLARHYYSTLNENLKDDEKLNANLINLLDILDKDELQC